MGLIISLTISTRLAQSAQPAKAIALNGQNVESDRLTPLMPDLDLTNFNGPTTSFSTSSDNPALPSCRIGVSSSGPEQLAYVADLEAGWLISFGTFVDPPVPGVEVTPLISVRQDKDEGVYLDSYTVTPPLTEEGLGQLLDTRPSQLWIVGNEVDRGPDPGQTVSGQGDTFPDVYARAYHEVYHYIKGRDPTAQVANAALVQVTPGRLQYLDLMWEAYKDQFGVMMPVDVWNMHVYILPEAELNGQPNGIANIALGTDPLLAKRGPGLDASHCALDEIYCFAEHDDLGVFAEQVLAMRKWMHDHGQRDKPLILSEFSLLYPFTFFPDDPPELCFRDENGECFTQDRVTDFLNNSMAYLDIATHPQYGDPSDNYRLVQQWNWYIIWTDSVGDISNLVDLDGSILTQVGQAFKVKAASQSRHANLEPSQASHPVVFSDQGSGLADATISVAFTNNGNRPVEQSFEVAFYKDEALTEQIATIMVEVADFGDFGLRACSRQEVVVTVQWSDLSPGLHYFWAEVDSTQVVIEAEPGGGGEDDNLIRGFVLVDPPQLRFPSIYR